MILTTLKQKTNFLFRDYQLEIIDKGVRQILDKNWCYLAMEVRTGKTLTSLGICEVLGGNKNVVFITKKKSIGSIESDFEQLNSKTIKLTVINYESIHKLEVDDVDVWILDEAHSLGAFPKPSKRAKQLKNLIKEDQKVIFLSGTPTPESISQIYHQFWTINYWNENTFYKWANRYVDIKERYLGHGKIKDYSDCKFKVEDLNLITFSQKEAGFVSEKREHFLNIEMSETTKKIINKLKKDKVVEGKNDVILADTSVKEMNKIHQLGSGTVVLESGEGVIIDESKAIYLKENFDGQKIAVFYKFKQEFELIKKHLDVTTDIDEFNQSNKNIALQFVAGREGIKLNNAECIVAFNIDFSATTYFQFRDRMTTKDRLISDIYYLISDCGIELDVYKAVSKKQNFTKQYYERTKNTKENNRTTRDRGLLCDQINKDEQKRNPGLNSTQTQQSLFR